MRGEENTTSASDMAALMLEIWAGPALTRESRGFALGLLLGQRLVSKIAVPSPPGARHAHKTGELEGVENDAGIFLLPGRSFVLAVLWSKETWDARRRPCRGHSGSSADSTPARMEGRRAGLAWVGCMNIPRFCMHETSWPCVGMRGRLDNVSVARLQCC